MSKNQIVLVTIILLLFTSTIIFSFLYLLDRLNETEIKISKLSESVGIIPSDNKNISSESGKIIQTDTCGVECKKTIDEIVAKAVSTISGKTKVVETKTVSVKTPQTDYIPMGTTYTTTSTDWYTIDESGLYIDLINDYGSAATVSWEASLKVAHGNGTAYARLWDDTHKIAVNGSELTTVNNPTYTLVSSADIPFWKGRNLYKIQLKSLNSFEVSYTGGKIRVSY